MRVNTKCCDVINAMGVVNPTFTWNITDCDATNQTAYELCVYNDDFSFESGKVESSQSVRVECSGLELKSNTKYFWKVKIYTNNGEFQSEENWFITGLTENEELKWITAPSEISAPLLRKEFSLDKVPALAVVNVCGLGFFELYINGKKVSDDFMQPVRTDYDTITYRGLLNNFDGITRKSVQYLTYEVSDYLKEGKNTVVIWLGNGWYRERARINIRGDFDYGDQLKAFLRLTADDFLLETDDTWQYKESPILHNNFFSGEIYDATKEDKAFFENGYVSNDFASFIKAPEARIVPQLCPGEKIIRVLPVTSPKKDIYDSGEVISGFARIKLKGKKGEKVEIFYAEEFDGENLDFKSAAGYVEWDINQIQKDVYILNGDEAEEYIPRFVYHAYRYFEIKHTENVEILDVDSVFVCTAMEQRAYVSCSDDTVNGIYKLYHNTVLSNLHGAAPLDCPNRERLPYTGDGQLSANAAVTVYDAYQTYKKWITDINDSQDEVSGFVPFTAPYSSGCGGHAWGSAVVTVAWHFYLQYGDKEFLRQSVPHMEKWVEYLKTHKGDDGLISKHEEGSWSLGDWVMPSKFPWSDPKPEAIKIHPDLVNTVYYIHCINMLLMAYKELGIEADSTYYDDKKECADALADKYVYEDGVFSEQEADVFLLYAHIVEGAKADDTFKKLLSKHEKRGYTFNSGMVGTELLFKLLDREERNDVALSMLTAKEYPSYGYMLKNGATTLWETWEGTGAKTHTAFSSIGAWYVYGLAGIKPDGGYKTFTIKPFFAEKLSFVDAKIDTEYGEIVSKWERKDGKILLCVKVPFNTKATLKAFGKETELYSGEYHFEYDEIN